ANRQPPTANRHPTTDNRQPTTDNRQPTTDNRQPTTDMSIKDPLIHPAFLDPRSWGEVDLYETTVNIEREPVSGEERQTPDRKFAIEHVKLDLRFDDERGTVSGTAAITMSPLNDGFDHFELDIAEMEIAGVRLQRVERRGTGDLLRTVPDHAARLEHETFPEKLAIELDRPYSRQEQLTVEIAYSCAPRKGVFFVKPDAAYPNKPRQIWSQGQTEDAHWWFPCHDVTNQKMTTELLATVPAKYFALSNGELLGVRETLSEGTRTYHWSQAQPHPAYLVTIVIGDYEVIRDSYDGLPVDYYVYRDRANEGRRLFANTPRMIEFFEKRFGYAYPYPKYAQIVVDDFLFGAMENTSASTFTDRCLLDDRAAIDINYDDIVAHELAHQWWGDLVTCKDWTQIWLNESFATYSEYLWREHTEGSDSARVALFQDFLTYLREDRTSHRRPIVLRRYRFSEEAMDRHAYEKGACVLHMLRWVLGEDAFFRSLSHYLNRFEFGVAETNDFKVAIEEATGQNLHWFFDQWIHGAGYPELEVSYEWRREERMLRLSVRQAQELTEGTPLFRFPVEVEILTTEPGDVIETERRATYRILLDKQEQEFHFPCDSKPKLVVFDKFHRLFKLMRFPKSSQELTFQLTRDEDVLGRMRAARELAEFKSEEVVRTLILAMTGSDFHGVRSAAAISLGEIGVDSARAALLRASRAETDPRVRRSCVFALGHFKEAADEIADHLRESLEKEQSYFVAVAAMRALARLGSDRAFDVLRSSLSRSSWQEVVAAAVFHGLSHAKDRRAVDLALEQCNPGAPTPLRVAAIGCLGTLGKEIRKDPRDEKENPADKIVDRLLDLLKDNNIRARVSAVRALAKIGNRRALPALRDAQTRECLDLLRAAILDAIKTLEDSPPA
ncbi:MAG: M1 family aminopeptidase, partial [Blastocatellia bacterium]|nr:M1 family aminopeptidase [Blastocatellia bacterium]